MQSRALGVQARTLEIYAQLGIVDRALELGKRGTGATLWAQGRRMAHVPLGDAGQCRHPLPFHPRARPGRQRTHHGREAQRSRRPRPVEHRTRRFRAACRPRRGDAEDARWRQPHPHRRLHRRLRWRAQRSAQAVEHRLPRRALRARLLRRRCRDDRHDGSGRGQRLSLARRLPPALPDARQGSLAHRRHRAAGTQGQRRSRPRRGHAFAAQRGRREPVDQRTAAGSRPTASTTALRSVFAIAAPSCSATPRTSTAPSARRA